ncbi:non-structural maintenance of chromosomes element 1 homolog [Gigantopelta aegis]|uniref:non-structural maintenance of chromosomes element 1 homolog n=1 Tax=Gigantopelta aegis TaxID=1735272 RepID=UPI001B88B1C5|nr:non-structural maintenance of chromosomes element 1 homolog [Gigantopelta aegis]XP_041358756.1 non-structural maintenance of chromosomes element 1 homolog [Gigantopelta aegis]XP_041358757.1 non-structural maintenance of chromosomes element 1 homolog [Gigantopelta aegis]XP_041358759.1 non-structural maintenance of chromosomes element 1 homolog [Gigantopelta aegis]
MTAMRPSHQMFLQTFMSRGILDAKEVKLMYKQCCEQFQEHYSDNEEERRRVLAEFVRTINSNLHPLHMEIKKGVNEDDGSNYYGLVSISESQITKLASDYTPNELEFFKKIVGLIVEADEGSISSIEALNQTEKLEKKISKNDAQDLLEKLQLEKWLSLTRGRVSLATRAILELEQYIKDVYPDTAKMCNLCKKLCLKGQGCEECGTKFHLHCASRFFRQDEAHCPGEGCGVAWVHEIPRRDTDATQAAPPERSSQRRRKERH